MTWNQFSKFGEFLTAVTLNSTSCSIVRKKYGSQELTASLFRVGLGGTSSETVALIHNTHHHRGHSVRETLRTCVLEMLGSDLGRDTGYTN
jgi:hypothetical protein